MKTGISTLIHDPGGRVQGIVVPNDADPERRGQGQGTPPRRRKK